VSTGLLPVAIQRSYKFALTPTTLVVTSDGTAERIWKGKWMLNDLGDAATEFGIDFFWTLMLVCTRSSSPNALRSHTLCPVLKDRSDLIGFQMSEVERMLATRGVRVGGVQSNLQQLTS
jgi:hypothetical protein